MGRGQSSISYHIIISSLSSTYVLAEAQEIHSFNFIVQLQSWNFFVCVQDIFGDLAADRKIRSFTIKCPSRSRGCQWTGELRAKDVSLIYSRFKIPKKKLHHSKLNYNVNQKIPTNCYNSYTNPTGKFCTCFTHVINDYADVANLAKTNRVLLPEEYLIRQHGRRFFVFLC